MSLRKRPVFLAAVFMSGLGIAMLTHETTHEGPIRWVSLVLVAFWMGLVTNEVSKD